MLRETRLRGRGNHERGQAAIFLTLALGIFLIGGVGFVVDGANLWFHRQSAQTGADAACTAGAMDLLSNAVGVAPPATNWIPSSADNSSFHCSGTTGRTQNSGFPPCSYANLNGYSGTSSQDVQVSFPVLSVLTTCPSSSPFPTACAADDVAATPYMQVDVHDSVPTTFMRLVGAGPSTTVPARSKCGLSNVLSTVPILILNPNSPSTVSSTLSEQGPFTLTVLTGSDSDAPFMRTLMQVNSSTSTTEMVRGDTIDLSQANNRTGGDFAEAGREPEPKSRRGTSRIDVGTSGDWVDAAGVISDPFASIPEPAQPAQTGAGVSGNYEAPCAEIPTAASCQHYTWGYYPSGINVPPSGTKLLTGQTSSGVAVFDPGIYYLDGDFIAGGTPANSTCLRPNTTSPLAEGTTFYFHGTSTLQVGANSGNANSGSFNCASTPVPIASVQCAASSNPLLSGIPALTGNVLLGPCEAAAGEPQQQPYGDPLGTGDKSGEQRGILFFQGRDTQPANQPTWQANGSFGLIGSIYFHSCASTSSSDSGANCDPTAFGDVFNLGSGAKAYIVGDIVVDQLQLGQNGGSSNITVSLNPNPQYYVLKASLLQ